MKGSLKKGICLALCLMCVCTLLTGCGGNQQQPAESPAVTQVATAIPTADASATKIPATPTPEVTLEPAPEAEKLTPQQRNAINMLNYLRALAQEIRASSNSRLYLEECYSTLLNNTHPNAVDLATLDEVMSLLDTLEKYRMIAVKRERLQYIYEQNKAQAIRDAVPNPMGLLSAVGSFSPAKLAASVLYLAVDAVTSYQSSSAAADLQYLQDGWQLDDEEATALHNSRKQLFSYMINMVNTFDLQGSLALSEDLVDEFVSWKNNENVVRRIQFLEANEETYQAFGPYWLALAESYYENENYAKCLSAVASYEALEMQIFRNDYDFARILPMAIVSAEYTMDDTSYVAVADDYCQKILANTNNDDWALRYFAAQIYIGLYSKTNEKSYLQKAYDITLNNVNHLVDEQRTMNATYLAEVVEQKAPKGETESAKKEREQYNKMLKEERKTELAPISEPLLLSCELLFALADELDIPASEQNKIDRMLHTKGESLFLIYPLDRLFWFDGKPAQIDSDTIEITFNGAEITIPAKYVSEGTAISVMAAGEKETNTFDSWRVIRVDRKVKDDIDSYLVTFRCDNTKYSGEEDVTITITPKPGSDTDIYTFTYRTEKPKYLGVEVGFLPDMQFHRITK